LPITTSRSPRPPDPRATRASEWPRRDGGLDGSDRRQSDRAGRALRESGRAQRRARLALPRVECSTMEIRVTRPPFWDEARSAFCEGAGDVVMAGFVADARGEHLRPRHDPFQTLAGSIVGQQNSVRAAEAVWCRFVAAVGEVSIERIAGASAATLLSCGLSRRKARYLAGLAAAFAGGARAHRGDCRSGGGAPARARDARLRCSRRRVAARRMAERARLRDVHREEAVLALRGAHRGRSPRGRGVGRGDRSGAAPYRRSAAADAVAVRLRTACEDRG
jgi:hypothetical protein